MTAVAPNTLGTVPFCGLPVTSADAIAPGTVAAVIGAGHSLGSAHQGTENGPFFLRTLSKAYTWSAETPTVLDLRAGVRSPRCTSSGIICVGGRPSCQTPYLNCPTEAVQLKKTSLTRSQQPSCSPKRRSPPNLPTA